MSAKQKGVLCIVASAFGFALMAFFVRLCDDYGGAVSCFQKSFFRNVIALLLALAVFLRGRIERIKNLELRIKNGGIGQSCASLNGERPSRPLSEAQKKDNTAILNSKFLILNSENNTAILNSKFLILNSLILRSVFGTIGIFANFYALSKIPIGEAMTLNKTAPFFTVFFSWILLGERVTRRQLVCLVLAFAGAVLVMKPGFRVGETHAALLALTGGLGAGLAYVCVHQLGKMKVNGAFIVLFFSAFSCLASLPFVLVDYAPMTFAQVLILLGAGIGAAIGQFGVTAAYRFAEPRSIAAYDYTNVIFTALFGFLFFSQVPDLISVAGFVIILLAAFRLH